ncbi:MAG: hypothetical protein ACR2MC_11305 [Actinomycetota bacterium]|nr:hypothetical protein [Gammaproteobacteria bacterium]
MTEQLDDAKGMTAVFPFVMLLSAYFATGFLFLSVNLPLLLEWAKGCKPGSLYNVLSVIPGFWRGILHYDAGVSVLLLSCLVALLVGFLFHPPALVFATILGKFVSWFVRVVLRSPAPLRFYAPPVFYGTGYIATADWFFRNRQAKVHYEWELFNYYLYAGITLNLIVGAGSFWALSAGGWLQGTFLLGVCAFSLAYCLARSAVVQSVYGHYSDRASSTGSIPPTA